jgi:hypothetical protein
LPQVDGETVDIPPAQVKEFTYSAYLLLLRYVVEITTK